MVQMDGGVRVERSLASLCGLGDQENVTTLNIAHSIVLDCTAHARKSVRMFEIILPCLHNFDDVCQRTAKAI